MNVKVNFLFNSLQLGKDFANHIDQAHRLKTTNEPEKLAPIQVTVKMDENGGSKIPQRQSKF